MQANSVFPYFYRGSVVGDAADTVIRYCHLRRGLAGYSAGITPILASIAGPPFGDRSKSVRLIAPAFASLRCAPSVGRLLGAIVPP